MDRLKIARDKIDKIDRELAELFEKRLEVVGDVIAYKISHNMKILDTSREKEVVEKNLKYIEDEKYKKYYTEFIHSLMNISKKYQEEILNFDKSKK